jgi:hypothetical protein
MLPSAGGTLVPATSAGSNACGRRAVGTPAELAGCIKLSALWSELTQFQNIANANKIQGHGYRDTFTPGYEASVDYVAARMQSAGYKVTIQRFPLTIHQPDGTAEFRTASRSYALEREWFVARGSGSGTIAAKIEPPRGSATGCAASDFAGFARGRVALLEAGSCAADAQVANAQAAGARAAVLYAGEGPPHIARLFERVDIPVVGVASNAIGEELLGQYRSGIAPDVYVRVRTRSYTGIDANVIADSPYGDPNHTVVIEGHLDSIFGAGMLDNASGSTTILDVALNLAKTPTRNHLRYVWFGGEELGLFGSRYYTKHLAPANLHRIAFDMDVDVTATPNFDILIADPAYATNVGRFPHNVVPKSRVGNAYFAGYFNAGGVISQPARFGNDGTDSNSFSLAGVPNTGVLTNQDCCKHVWETNLWGGFRGNYEGRIPSFNGGCVDRPNRWCDNLSNNDRFVFELMSRAVAYVTFELANDASL